LSIINSPSANVAVFRSIIEENTTLYVSTSGNDITGDGSLSNPWKTPHRALEWLSDKFIKTNKTVTIKCLDGIYSISETLIPQHPCGHLITLSGETVLEKTLNSIQSSSGSSGDYSIVLNLNNVTDIETDNYIIIPYNVSGGTNTTYACGCHKITNVDSANNRITIKSTHRKGAPSGAVSGTVKIFKTVFDCSVEFINIRRQCAFNIENFVIKKESTGGGDRGINVKYGGYLRASNSIGISGFAVGATIYGTGVLKDCAISSSTDYSGVELYNNAKLDCQKSVISGCAHHGLYVYYGSIAYARYLVSTGNVYNGMFAGYTSTIVAIDSSSTGNGDYGWKAYYNSVIRRTGSCTGGNNTNGDNNATYGSYVKTS